MSRQKTLFNLGIVFNKEFNVVFTVSSFVGNPAVFIKKILAKVPGVAGGNFFDF